MSGHKNSGMSEGISTLNPMLQPEAQRRIVTEAVELLSSRSRWEPFGAVIEIIEAEDVAKRKAVDCSGRGDTNTGDR